METNTFNADLPQSIDSNTVKLVSFNEFNEASKPLQNERLIKVLYRVDSKTGKKPKESVCVSVPVIEAETVKANIDRLLPLFLVSIQEQQDKIARKLYEEGNKSISTTQLGLDAIAEFLEESIYESRLTKEMIESWFDTVVSAKLIQALEAKGLNIDTSKLVLEYKNKFSALAGGRTTYETIIANALLKVFDLIEDAEDTLTVRLFTRLSDMLTKVKKTEENLLIL